MKCMNLPIISNNILLLLFCIINVKIEVKILCYKSLKLEFCLNYYDKREN